ncbi:MAG: hypothetical protein ACLPX9_13080 [Rhodomicrobium sp.]
MLVHNEHAIRSDIEALFPGHPEPMIPKKAADKLQSHLINGFETALDQGIPPEDALAIVLRWVSTEMLRIGSERPGNS